MMIPDALSDRWRGTVIAAAAVVLIALCWNAPFLNYDDPNHIHQNTQVMGPFNLRAIVSEPSDYKYFPLTILSYRLDRALFEGWMPGLFGSWAPGVRAMTLLYHAATAVLVWRILLLLGLGRSAAFFGGLIFSIHPMGCETVAWASERKTALAGLFGFAALFIYLRFESRPWRIPASAVLLLFALLSKPSALGLLPVFGWIEFLRHPRESAAQAPSPIPAWLRSWARLVPFAVLALIMTWLQIGMHQRTIIPPPGGSLFTALLTDIEILPRYLFNVLIPVRLSLVYFVEPILSLADPRLWLYGAALGISVGLSLVFAADRRRAALGWLWFVGALLPTLNFVGISNLMQDRFLYLSLPGLLLALAETARGIAQKFNIHGLLNRLVLGYCVMLAAGACMRSAIFADLHTLFADAVAKQPRAAHAHYGYTLGLIERVNAVNNGPGSPAEKSKILYALRHEIGQHDCLFMDDSPDADRQLNYAPIALRAAEYRIEFDPLAPGKYLADIERYLTKASEGMPFLPPQPDVRGTALRYLAGLKLRQQQPRAAYDFADSAVKTLPTPHAALARAQSAVAWLNAGAPETERAALIAQTKSDLDSIPRDSSAYAPALALKATPVLNAGAR